MINMKNLIDIYDWLIDQPGETPKLHADTLEMLILAISSIGKKSIKRRLRMIPPFRNRI